MEFKLNNQLITHYYSHPQSRETDMREKSRDSDLENPSQIKIDYLAHWKGCCQLTSNIQMISLQGAFKLIFALRSKVGE